MPPLAHSMLPRGVRVLERGWLSSNSVVFLQGDQKAVIDTGYATHSAQTVSLLEECLKGRELDLILNTHLHSDHCGGNAALQSRFAGVRTLIPPGKAQAVVDWDPAALSYLPTGQICPRFRMDGVLEPGTEIWLGDLRWQVHAAPGHDPNSLVFFEPGSGVLISADALWESGFGVVFQELEGERAFDEVAATLDLIDSLAPKVVVPGHGKVFTDVAQALEAARKRLNGFRANPGKHAVYAAKVLMKFKLLELQGLPLVELIRWARKTPYFTLLHGRWFADHDVEEWQMQLIDGLVRSRAAAIEGDWIFDR